MSSKAASGRVLRLPRRGRLLVCTDLHGNLRDFRRMRELFLARREREGGCHLLFTGDLVHGPNFSQSDWPDFLGTYYEDESGLLVEEFIALRQDYPDHVHCLLGNHEHSHIGGPHTPKFWADETVYFERSVGAARSERYRDAFRTFHLLALTGCGIAVMHAAPNVAVTAIEEIENLDYDGYQDMSLDSIQNMPLLGRLLWARRCPRETARAFLNVLSQGEQAIHLIVFGHDVMPTGFAHLGTEQLLLSSSFGLQDGSKRFLDVDLGGHYESTDDLRPDHELFPLYD